MANTDSILKVQWDGQRGSVHWNMTSDGTAETDKALVTLTSLAPVPGSVKIRTIQCTVYGNWILTLEFDATTDEPFAVIENQTADVSFGYVVDFTDMPNGGWIPTKGAAGFTGIIQATSSGLAASDGVDLIITFERNS